jgi:hypothetical protein
MKQVLKADTKKTHYDKIELESGPQRKWCPNDPKINI